MSTKKRSLKSKDSSKKLPSPPPSLDQEIESLEAEASRLREELRLENERAELLALEKDIREGLPFKDGHGDKFYPFMRRFWESRKYKQVICSPNQVGKSSIQIRRDMEWITNEKRWPILWPLRPVPRTFWYLYPNKSTATSEFYDKWVTEFLPRGKFQKDPQFGWEEERKQGDIHAIHWKIGITQYFKTYAQNVHDLQSGTVWKISADEEPPAEIIPELLMRLSATDGYFSAAFTATRGQLFWKRVVEGRGEKRIWPECDRFQVSLYDCMKYEDGTASPWTRQRIKRREQELGSKNEIDKRIHGKFVIDRDRLVECFDEEKHYVKGHPINGWHVYSGVDPGSGGQSHPAAIAFVAVKPDFTEGRVIKLWRGDNVITASTDILQKYRELRGSMKPISERYDWESAEFGILAARLGEPFVKANKDREAGFAILNSLFRNDMLKIYESEADPQGMRESDKLVDELNSVKTTDKKSGAADDLIDALRYAIMDIPWDFSKINPKIDSKPEIIPDERTAGLRAPLQTPDEALDVLRDEVDEADFLLNDYGFD